MEFKNSSNLHRGVIKDDLQCLWKDKGVYSFPNQELCDYRIHSHFLRSI